MMLVPNRDFDLFDDIFGDSFFRKSESKMMKTDIREDKDNYVIDIDKRTVFDGEKELSLTTLEFDLLMMFLQNRNKSFSREDILETVWGSDYFGSDRVVDDLVRRLRKKMPNIHINTLYGFGYRFL